MRTHVVLFFKQADLVSHVIAGPQLYVYRHRLRCCFCHCRCMKFSAKQMFILSFYHPQFYYYEARTTLTNLQQFWCSHVGQSTLYLPVLWPDFLLVGFAFPLPLIICLSFRLKTFVDGIDDVGSDNISSARRLLDGRHQSPGWVWFGESHVLVLRLFSQRVI